MTQIGEGIAALFGFGGPVEPGSLEVTVVERKSGEPVGGVTVTLRGPSGGSAVTGADGKARFPELEPGLYRAAATQDEFEMRYGSPLVHVGAGEAEAFSLSVRRIMLTIIVKRIHIGQEWTAGHWWTEIGPKESYGWYPADHPDPLWKGLTGVPGRLNGARGAGSPTRDAHHGETKGEAFHPRIVNGKPAEAIRDCIRAFARSYHGTWSWPGGQNCHSFQRELMKHCGLEEGGQPVKAK